MTPLALQVYAVAVLLLTGMAIGLLYDVFRGLRLGLAADPTNAWAVAAADGLFWLTAAGVGVLGLLMGNWGQMRLYVLAALAVGIWAYFVLASPFILGAWVWLVKTASRVTAAAARLLWTVVTWPFAVVGTAAAWLLAPFVEFLKRMAHRLFEWAAGTSLRWLRRRLQRWRGSCRNGEQG